MAIINRFRGSEGEVSEQSGCLCKHRGVESDYPDGLPEDFQPDTGDKPVTKKQFVPVDTPTTDTQQTASRSIVDDMTFGDIVNLINHLVKEVNDIKKRIG